MAHFKKQRRFISKNNKYGRPRSMFRFLFFYVIFWYFVIFAKQQQEGTTSETRLGELLDLEQPFKAFSNN